MSIKKIKINKSFRYIKKIQKDDWISKLVFFSYAIAMIVMGILGQIYLDATLFIWILFYLIGVACAIFGFLSKRILMWSLTHQRSPT